MTSRKLALLTVLAVSLSTLLAAACGSSTSSSTTSGSGGGSGGSASGSGGASGGGAGGGGAGACPNPPDLEADAPMCNTVANGATAVPFTARTGTPPSPAGGAIRDGVYRSIRAEGYGAAAAQNGRKLTIVILNGGTRWLWAGDVLDAAGASAVSSLRADADVVVSSTSVAFTTTCTMTSPSPLPASLDYSVNGDELALSRTAAADNTAVTTYMRVGCP